MKKESGLEVELDSSGKIGEFTVWVDGKLVAQKEKFLFPDKQRILAAVQRELG